MYDTGGLGGNNNTWGIQYNKSTTIGYHRQPLTYSKKILRLGNNNSCVIQVTLERSDIKILNDTNFLNLR